MKTKLINLWYWLGSSFWFLPMLMVIAAIVLSYAAIQLDRSYQSSTGRWWIYGGDTEGARELLSVVAGSMITVAGVVFSITIVVLSLTSQQFGPRLIWNFMHDTGNQVVLGIFISTFMYCLLVLRKIQGNGKTAYTPEISVSLGIVLAIASLGVLIYFIHHISASIQANQVVAGVYRDLENAIARLYTDDEEGKETRQEKSGDKPSEDFEVGSYLVRASDNGYLQAIDRKGLLNIAVENDLLLRIEYRPGQFVTRGNVLARVRPAEKANDGISRRIDSAFILGNQRTVEQDVEFAVNQLVEVAVRALSPGINDPFTALACIDWLCAALCTVAEKQPPQPYVRDRNGRIRLMLSPFTFGGVVDAAFNQIRQNGRSVPAVAIRLLESIAVIAGRTCIEGDRRILLNHALMIKHGSDSDIPDELDRKDVEERYLKAVKALHPGSSGPVESPA